MNSRALRIPTWGLRGAAAALTAVALTPALAGAQTPVPGTPPAATTPTQPKPGDPGSNIVVPANAEDPVAGLAQPADEVILSDEKKTTRWGHAQDNSRIRISPNTGARPVARLRFFTEDGLPEVYLALRARMDSLRRVWIEIRVPRRPNGTIGWVRQDSLSSQLYVVGTQLVVARKKLRAQLFKNGRVIWSARVGIGKSSTPTPMGNFWIRERLKGLGNGSAYGPWAFGTSAYSNVSDWPGPPVVGIHGTNRPGLIPGRPSAGCIRVRNDKIRLLARLMPIGTPVKIID